MKQKSKSLAVIRTMPPQSHYPNRMVEFDVTHSEVAQWIASQPEVLQYLFNKARDRGLIVFDPLTQQWRGADYKLPQSKLNTDRHCQCDLCREMHRLANL